jgi:uracil phosphoribosyltransferase
MPVTVLDHPLATARLATLRDVATPTPAFRAAMHALGLLLAAEATRHVQTVSVRVQTPLAPCDTQQIAPVAPAVISVLRAGQGLVAPFLDVLPEAAVGTIGLARDPVTHVPAPYHEKLPERLDGRVVFVVDPMLATGLSAIDAVDRVLRAGAQRVIFVAVLAAPEGVAALTAAHPGLEVIVAAVDDHLDANRYIVPGLGDAGDRYFGTAGHG